MKKKLLFLIMFCGVQLFNSCSNSKNRSNIITCDFDELKNWNISNEAISNKLSRSGKYSIFTGPERVYSLTYEAEVKDLLAKGYTKMTASIWIRCIGDPKEAQWVATVNSPTGANYIWKSTFLSSAQETDDKGWKRIEVKLDLPMELNDGILKIYGWAPKQEEASFDDFELTFE